MAQMPQYEDHFRGRIAPSVGTMTGSSANFAGKIGIVVLEISKQAVTFRRLQALPEKINWSSLYDPTSTYMHAGLERYGRR
jgi:hypothetical protein